MRWIVCFFRSEMKTKWASEKCTKLWMNFIYLHLWAQLNRELKNNNPEWKLLANPMELWNRNIKIIFLFYFSSSRTFVYSVFKSKHCRANREKGMNALNWNQISNILNSHRFLIVCSFHFYAKNLTLSVTMLRCNQFVIVLIFISVSLWMLRKH